MRIVQIITENLQSYVKENVVCQHCDTKNEHRLKGRRKKGKENSIIRKISKEIKVTVAGLPKEENGGSDGSKMGKN